MYEMQIAAIKRNKIVCSVEAHLNHLSEKDAVAQKQGVMEYVGYSRFVLFLIDKSGSTIITPKANIPVADIFYIKEMKDIALAQKAAYDLGGSKPAENTSASFSGQTIPFGPNRGKTIPELAANSDSSELQRLREFLEKNAAAHAVNQKLIADIDKALALMEAGNTAALSATSKKSITVYEQKMKYLSSTQDTEGRVFVYSIVFTCDLTKDMPWCVEVTNGYAPLEKNSIGLKTPKASAMVNKISSSMQMNSPEFCGLIDKMFYAARDYDNQLFMDQYTLAQKMAEKAKADYLSARDITAGE